MARSSNDQQLQKTKQICKVHCLLECSGQNKRTLNRSNKRRKSMVLKSLSRYLRGVFSQRQSRFEQAIRLLATFVCSHHSLRLLALQHSTSLRSLRSPTPFMGWLIHFAHSLVVQLKILNMCSRCKRVQQEQTRFWLSVKTRL